MPGKRLASVTERLERHGREGMQLAERLALSGAGPPDWMPNWPRRGRSRRGCRLELAELRNQEDELKKRLPDIRKRSGNRGGMN